MANDKKKNDIPFGGRDWNGNGEYDNFDRMTDFYVYKKVTEDWRKNGAWDKPKKAKSQYSKPTTTSDTDNTVLDLIGMLLVLGLTIFAFSESFLFGLFMMACFLCGVYQMFKDN